MSSVPTLSGLLPLLFPLATALLILSPLALTSLLPFTLLLSPFSSIFLCLLSLQVGKLLQALLLLLRLPLLLLRPPSYCSCGLFIRERDAASTTSAALRSRSLSWVAVASRRARILGVSWHRNTFVFVLGLYKSFNDICNSGCGCCGRLQQ